MRSPEQLQSNPYERVVWWLQLTLFTHSTAYFHETAKQRVIDGTIGTDELSLWVGLNDESRIGSIRQNDDAVAIGHVNFERRDHSLPYDMRFYSIQSNGRIYYRHQEGKEYTEEKFLTDSEVEELALELAQVET